jgi:hypothetical protein
MIKSDQSVFKVLLILLFAVLMSCQANKTPVQVSEHFWLGIQTKNSALVKKYSLSNSIDEQEDFGRFENIKATSFGKIIIDGNSSEIETTITMLVDEKEVEVKLTTYLENHNDVWKVNFRKTVLPLAFNQNMAEVFGDIEEIKEEITEQIEESVEEIKEKVVPEIKSEIEKAEKEIIEKLPELKNVFEEFLRELEKSLEELMPKEKDEEVITHET